MHELTGAFLADVLRRPPAGREVDELVTSYLREWNAGVTAIPGVSAVLADLASDHRLAVVTNTHHPELVPDHLDALGIATHIDAVITSVEVGWRKPHPAIFHAAMATMGVEVSDAVFVGDTRAADYDGPRSLGMHPLLIDPDRAHDIPAEQQLDSILDLPGRLSRRGGARR